MSKKNETKDYFNSLSSLVNSIVNGGWEGNGVMPRGSQTSQAETLFKNNRNYFISNFRYLLSESYVEHGLIQTMVDLPVDDAFRADIDFKTDQLTKEEKIKVANFMENKDAIEHFKNALKWSRLFGGGGLIIMTGEKDLSKPLDLSKLKDKPVEFIDVDLWELYFGEFKDEQENYSQQIFEQLLFKPEIYNYYGERLHKSRVLRFEGRKAPSFVRPRLRGWGFSILEVLIRGFNQYLKGVNATFEMLDEVKVDVFSINNFAMSLMTDKGEQAVRKRIMLANSLKNYLNALVLDKNDSYDTKSRSSSFSGLAEVMKEIRYQIASDLRMPLSKIFGIASSGFSSGEDDIKNYNTMVETQIRSKCVNDLKKLYKICVAICLGKEITDLRISFGTLDYETPKDLAIRKNSEFQRLILCYERGLISVKELKEMINKVDALPIAIPVEDKIYDNLPVQMARAGDTQSVDTSVNKIGLDDLKTRIFSEGMDKIDILEKAINSGDIESAKILIKDIKEEK